MLRIVAWTISTLLLLGAGFFAWKSWASQESPVPPAPPPSAAAAALNSPLRPLPVEEPPAASPKSREEKRFGRADRDDDGRITKLELLEPRRKAFAKLDTDGNGNLSFEEWTVRTATKFAEADANRDGVLLAAEYATTAPKPRAKPKCSC